MALAENVMSIEVMNKTQRKKVSHAVQYVWQLHGGTYPAVLLKFQKNLKSDREFMWVYVYIHYSMNIYHYLWREYLPDIRK